VIFEKTAVSCGMWKSSYEKVDVGKAEDRLVNWLWLLKTALRAPHVIHISAISPSF